MTEEISTRRGSPIRVIVLAEQALVAEMLELRLQAAPDIAVVATSQAGPGALGGIVHHRPDVVVLDEARPGGEALEAIGRLRATHPDIAVVLLTGDGEPAVPPVPPESEVHGYAFRRQPGEALLVAIRAAAQGCRPGAAPAEGPPRPTGACTHGSERAA
jgi:DNA-binding NarL/FixJ family response regulator